MIFDNFGQELKDYDIVATSGTDYQCNIAIYYKLTLITWQDFDARHRNNSIVTSKKCRVYNTDREQSLVDYTDIRDGKDYIIKGVIKLPNLTEPFVFFRENIIKALRDNRFSNKINRIHVNEILEHNKI